MVGERFEFELTTVDGKRISSEALRGRVVLLDFWAKWCGPCMAKMPRLKETYEKLHGRGFEIVGLSHDYTLEQARRVIADQKLSWPNVVAPIDNEQRHAWFEATGTGSLPRLLLLDRKGILRAEVSPHNLDAEIEKLMNHRWNRNRSQTIFAIFRYYLRTTKVLRSSISIGSARARFARDARRSPCRFVSIRCSFIVGSSGGLAL